VAEPKESRSGEKTSSWSQYLDARIQLWQLEWKECQQKLILKAVAVIFVLVCAIGLLDIYFHFVKQVCHVLSWRAIINLCDCSSSWTELWVACLSTCLVVVWHGGIAWLLFKAVIAKKEKFFQTSFDELQSDFDWIKGRLPGGGKQKKKEQFKDV